MHNSVLDIVFEYRNDTCVYVIDSSVGIFRILNVHSRA